MGAGVCRYGIPNTSGVPAGQSFVSLECQARQLQRVTSLTSYGSRNRLASGILRVATLRGGKTARNAITRPARFEPGTPLAGRRYLFFSLGFSGRLSKFASGSPSVRMRNGLRRNKFPFRCGLRRSDGYRMSAVQTASVSGHYSSRSRANQRLWI